jgi:putative FmdB family regulatory protein
VPTYDYLCTVCGHGLEVVHGIHGHGPTTCPVCGGPMRKAFAAPAVHFKGSGWAKKDRGAAVSTRAAAKADAGGDGASGASTKAADEGTPSRSDKSTTASTASTASDPPAARPSSSAPSEAD